MPSQHTPRKSMQAKDKQWVAFGCSIRKNSKTVSALAIVETVVASCLGIYAAFAWGSIKWYAAYILIAPFLLLKTNASTRRGLMIGHRIVDVFTPVINWTWDRTERAKSKFDFFVANFMHLAVCIPVFTVVVIGTPIVKILATYLEWKRDWLLPLRSLPKNWIAICLQTDSSVLPEMLPGSSAMVEKHECNSGSFASLQGGFPAYLRANRQRGVVFSLRALFRGLWNSNRSSFARIWSAVLMSPVLIGIVFFGFAYRWALKATALFWVPLLFFSQSIFRSNDKLERRLEEIIDSPISQTQRVWAVILFSIHVLIPMICWHCFVGFTQSCILAVPDMKPLLEYFFVIDSARNADLPMVAWHLTVKSWHVTGVIGGVVTWVLWNLARNYRLEIGHDMLTSRQKMGALRRLQFLQFCRAACMTWVLFCGISPAIKTFRSTKLRVDFIIFPSVNGKAG